MPSKLVPIFLVLLWFQLPAQVRDYNLKLPEPRETTKICGEFLNRMSAMPADVTLGLYEKEGEIFWGITDDTWLARILKDNKDGIAVDVISKSQFPCGKKNVLADSKVYKGELLKPVYLKDVKNRILTDNLGMAGFKVADLPEAYKGTEYELNMIMIHDGFVCNYNSFYDVPRARWELLHMPMYMDSSRSENASDKGKPVALHKTLRFVIPFEKNKYTYSDDNIRPLYDSLKLKDYTILSIDIKAYASVEGPTENNIRLQNNRAEAIAKALEKGQSRSAIKKITAEENWVEFIQDVDSTLFPDVENLSRAEIKARLEDQKLSSALEPLLSKHRKAIITLEVESRSTYMEASAKALANEFRRSIENRDSASALAIQEVSFARAMKGNLPSDLLDTIEIPVERKYMFLHNNRVAFAGGEELSDLEKKISMFEELKKQFPGYHSIDYNIAVLKIKAWSKGETIDPAVLRQDIKNLSTWKVAPSLVKRLFINYHIVLSELLISQRKYDAKNQALKFIYDNYKALALGDKDLLELAKYFSSYSRFDWAEKILLARVKSLDADEDLVFYYLNLTIIEPKNLKKSSYRSIVNNAAAKNPSRFCKMFDPYGKGGINFQLLADDYLKKLYCEVCKAHSNN